MLDLLELVPGPDEEEHRARPDALVLLERHRHDVDAGVAAALAEELDEFAHLRPAVHVEDPFTDLAEKRLIDVQAFQRTVDDDSPFREALLSFRVRPPWKRLGRGSPVPPPSRSLVLALGPVGLEVRAVALEARGVALDAAVPALELCSLGVAEGLPPLDRLFVAVCGSHVERGGVHVPADEVVHPDESTRA